MAALTSAQRRIQTAAMQLYAELGVTNLSVSQLAERAGVARGTIYKNVGDIAQLFDQVAYQLSHEMHIRISASFEGVNDPAHRLANGIRHFVRRSHEEPQWGVFLTRFALSTSPLRDLLYSQVTRDLQTGLSLRRYHFPPDQLTSVITMVSGTTLSAMYIVNAGIQTWRAVGSDCAELILVALGIPISQAKEIVNLDLPPLAPAGATMHFEGELSPSQ